MLGGNPLGWAYLGEGEAAAAGSISAPFIASVTVVHAPSLPEVSAPFIASRTVVHAPGVGISGDVTLTTPGTYIWVCPQGVTQVHVKCYGGGGAGGNSQHRGLPFVNGGAGGGGGAFAERLTVPVTPGNTYTIVVGTAGSQGSPGSDGGASSFTGDSGVHVIAVGGHAANQDTKGTGGAAGSSTGDVGHVFSGGDGGAGTQTANSGGAGGGASGDGAGAGANGSDSIPGTNAGQPGGTGASGGGSGGNGGSLGLDGSSGVTPGGGGGGGGWDTGHAGIGGNGAPGEVVLTVVTTPVNVPFIASTTTLYAPEIVGHIPVPFIASRTVVYTPDLPEVRVPFIGSKTRVFDVFSLFDPNKRYAGAGNGGEVFTIRLAANGVTATATLAANISSSATALSLTGDGSLPSSEPFMLAIDSEILYVVQLAPGSYRIRGRGMSNTTPASHTAGATVSWGDSYDMPIRASVPIAGSFTADITGSGSYTYPGWLVAFDSSQAYLSGSRYPMHVAELLGVFAAGAGSSGSNKCDAAQPNVVSTPAALSDDCPIGLGNPSRVQTDINVGDVALVRYTNPEASVLDLGPRSTAIQSWFGLKRVDATDVDVTFTDPNGIVVDTTGAEGTYTGSVTDEFNNPSSIGPGPDTGTPTPNPEPFTNATLPGSDRKMTYGPPGYSEKGWPFGVVAVRQGNRRVPVWRSYDWHNFSYVYCGFGTDDTFAQIAINRNGIIFGPLPSVSLPGPQDITGPNAVWDDGSYYFAVAWYVAIFAGPYLVIGPSIGGSGGGGGTGGEPPMPIVGFGDGGGTGGGPGPPVVNPPPVEGGDGGGITGVPVAGLFQAASV